MSIVAAVTDGTRAWVGSDTQTTRGDEVGFKGIRWRGAALGIAGEFFALQAFRHWLVKETPPSDPVALALHLRELTQLHRMGHWDEGTKILEFTALYVLPTEIWHIASDFTVVRCVGGTVHAIGSGNEVTSGALWGAQRAGKRFKSLRASLKFGIEAAIAREKGCGGDVIIHRVR
ncbi:MAG: hypothetical protein IID18_08225 [Nitrospinae bacterium]|nr:hypothetical protein [Nitrospinota bacterium]